MAKFKKARTDIKFKTIAIETMIIGILFVLFASYANADCGCIGMNTNTIYKCGDNVSESCILNCCLTCSGHGLRVNADNIILDGNGYTLTGPENNYLGNSYTVGIITNNKENITIKNFEIMNFSNGLIPVPLAMGGSMKNYSIINNTVHHMSSCGISLSGASNSKIINNTCHSIKLDGIDSSPGNNNLIENNTCYNNKGGIGFYGSTTQNNTIRNNNLFNNKWGIIFGWMGPNYNKILDNTIYNNTYFGIYLYYGSSFNEIYNNTIKGNKNGIFLTKCHPITNVCYVLNVTNNTIAYNKISGNSEYGIYINSSLNNTLISNKICENNIDIAIFNGTINATGNSGDNNSCTLARNYEDFSAGSNNSCTNICNCSTNSQCISNKCVNEICKTPSKNISVGLVVKFPNNSTITRCVNVPEYANGKEIFEKSNINFSGTTGPSWGFFLECINGTCSPSDWSWYWNFNLIKENETNWTSMSVGMGPGGTLNDICDSGHYCARDGDVILLNATAAPGRDVSPSEGQICKKDNSTCSSNSQCISNKCVNGICKTPSKNISVGLVVKFPNNSTITGCVNVPEYANGKEILEKSNINFSGTTDLSWGFFLECINGTCSPYDWSWYWNFNLIKENETSWTFMSVGMGPGGTSNDFCDSSSGHYCARDKDILGFNVTTGGIMPVYNWCMEGDFDNNNLTDIFDIVYGLEYLSEKNNSESSEKCIRKEHINLFEILKLIEKIGLS